VQHTIPAGLLFSLVEAVRHVGVTADELLGVLDLSERDLLQPRARFSLALYLSAVERARALTAEPGIGFLWGLEMKISTLGTLGFATMTSATLGDALLLATEMSALGSTAEPMRLVVANGVASLMLDELADFGAVRDVVMMARLTSLWRIAESMLGRPLDASADVALAEPPYYRRFARQVPTVRFGQPATRALFSAEVLHYPLVFASPVAIHLAREQCERELESLSDRGRLLREVQGLLFDSAGRLRSSAEVADAARMSERTLRRRLAEHGISLSKLVEQERRARALLLLRDRGLSLETIADRLSYSNVQSFERAFGRWTGATPAAHRRRQ
jgi:AraC-like DNA-binding protein